MWGKNPALRNINVPAFGISPDRTNKFKYPDRTNKFIDIKRTCSILAGGCLPKLYSNSSYVISIVQLVNAMNSMEKT